MSRNYRLEVEFKWIGRDEVKQYFTDHTDWALIGEDTYFLEYDARLCGGRTEQEAHKEIEVDLKNIDAECQVHTKWWCLEDLPYEEYGDDIDWGIPTANQTIDDINQLFESILTRINENNPNDKIVILDTAKRLAIVDYVAKHPNDKIIFGDD